METQSWLDHALDCGYLNERMYTEQDNQWQRTGAMLSRMIEHGACLVLSAR